MLPYLDIRGVNKYPSYKIPNTSNYVVGAIYSIIIRALPAVNVPVAAT